MQNGEEGIRKFGFETIFVKQEQGIELSLSPHFSSAFLYLARRIFAPLESSAACWLSTVITTPGCGSPKERCNSREEYGHLEFRRKEYSRCIDLRALWM